MLIRWICLVINLISNFTVNTFFAWSGQCGWCSFLFLFIFMPILALDCCCRSIDWKPARDMWCRRDEWTAAKQIARIQMTNAKFPSVIVIHINSHSGMPHIDCLIFDCSSKRHSDIWMNKSINCFNSLNIWVPQTTRSIASKFSKTSYQDNIVVVLDRVMCINW